MRHEREALEEEKERLRALASALPDEQRQAFYRDVGRRLKDPDTYAAVNWSLVVGLHHFYLGRWLRGLADVLAVVVGVLLIPLAPVAGYGLIGIVLLVELIALFRSQAVVLAHNNAVYRDALLRHGVDPTGDGRSLARR